MERLICSCSAARALRPRVPVRHPRSAKRVEHAEHVEVHHADVDVGRTRRSGVEVAQLLEGRLEAGDVAVGADRRLGRGLGLGALFLLWVVPTLADAQRLGLLPWPRHVQAQLLFQAWNEEIVLGALFLLPLVRRTKRPVLTSLTVAVVFAGLHVLLYGFGAHGRWLDPMAVATLVAVGALRNVLLLLTGHIGLAFALHAAWNVSMFAGVWYQVPGMWRLSEPQVFDAFLGQPAMVVATAVTAVLGHVALARRTLREGEGRST